MQKKNMSWEKIRQIKGLPFVIGAALVGVILILLGPLLSETDKKNSGEESASYYSVRYYTETMENRIADICRHVRGVTEAHVLLTLEGGSEYVYAENTSGSAHDYLIIESKSSF